MRQHNTRTGSGIDEAHTHTVKHRAGKSSTGNLRNKKPRNETLRIYIRAGNANARAGAFNTGLWRGCGHGIRLWPIHEERGMG